MWIYVELAVVFFPLPVWTLKAFQRHKCRRSISHCLFSCWYKSFKFKYWQLKAHKIKMSPALIQMFIGAPRQLSSTRHLPGATKINTIRYDVCLDTTFLQSLSIRRSEPRYWFLEHLGYSHFLSILPFTAAYSLQISPYIHGCHCWSPCCQRYQHQRHFFQTYEKNRLGRQKIFIEDW